MEDRLLSFLVLINDYFPSAGSQSIYPAVGYVALATRLRAKSLAITCLDPDAPTGAGFWHWAVFNIPTTVTEIPTGAGDETLGGIEGVVSLKGDSGKRGFYGAQPPAGHAPHRYLFAVHALDVEKLDIAPDATPTVLGFNLYFHTLGRSIVWGWYEN